MSEPTPEQKPPCKICGAQPDEHEGRQHAYTTVEGELVTPDEKKKAQGGPPQRMIIGGAVPAPTDTVGRLVEVMLEKGLFTPGEALYVAGMGPKPTGKSGFADPVM